MKPNVKMIDKSKNSFIYFQLGLIATLVAVLFVLEINFETSTPINDIVKVDLPDEEPFTTYVVLKETPKSEPRKTMVTKPIAKVVQPKVVNQFKETKDNVDDNAIKNTSHQDTNPDVATTTDNTNPVDSTDSNDKGEKKDEVFVVVEFLPMFPSCKDISKEDQKECFDKALKKEIFKNLKYPEKDLENKTEGTVFVQFIVDENGNFTSIKSADNKRATNDMRIAVENAVKKLPKIIPAKQGKNDVKVTYTIPITFKINK